MARVTPTVKVLRYSDPDRSSLAHVAAVFLGKEDTNNVKRPVNMLTHTPPHKSIFRGEHVRFEFTTSKVVYDHLVTYTTADVRACAGLRANLAGEFVIPLEVVETELEEVIDHIGNEHRNDYIKLTKGIDPGTEDPVQKARLQAARSVAPTSVTLHYILQFNFLTLMEAFFPQRLWSPGAQADTREVAQMMWDAVYPYDTELWDMAKEAFGPEALAWQDLRWKLKKKEITVEDIYLFLNGEQMKNWDDGVDRDAPAVTGLLDKYGGMKSMWK